MAISASSYSVGNRVYRGGSSAPTQGTVDPMGYIDRGLNNPSQKRSGLAEAALRRLGGRNRGAGQTGPGGRPQESDRPNAYGLETQTQSGQARGLGAPTGGPPGLGGQQPPGLQMSAIGKLQAPDLAAKFGGTGLPFDIDAADAQQQLLSRKNRFEQEFTQGQQGLERDYTLQRRSVEDQLPDERRNLLENYAGRGLAYSSGYAYDTGDLEGQYANLLAQLEGGKTEGLADLLRQRGLFNEDYASQLQAIQAAAARRLSDQAGDLGLNNGAPANGGQGILDSLFPQQPQAPVEAAPIPQAPAPQPIAQPITHYTPPRPTFNQNPAPAPAPAPVAPAPVPQPAPRLNNPAAPPSHTNPWLTGNQASTPSMLNPGDPGGRRGMTLAQIAASQAHMIPGASPAPAPAPKPAPRRSSSPRSRTSRR